MSYNFNVQGKPTDPEKEIMSNPVDIIKSLFKKDFMATYGDKFGTSSTAYGATGALRTWRPSKEQEEGAPLDIGKMLKAESDIVAMRISLRDAQIYQLEAEVKKLNAEVSFYRAKNEQRK